MEIIRASSMEGNPHQRMGEIFTEGFYQWLKYFSKDKDKLAKALAHMFNPEIFYLALIQGRIAGMAALNDGCKPTVVLQKKEMQTHLGRLRGLIAYKILKSEFMDKKYPFALKPGMGCVEFVTTDPDFRGQGVASALIKHFFTIAEYNEYALEVADTNEGAVRLYEKLGFNEFLRIEMKNKKQSGVNHLLYMSCTPSFSHCQ